MAVKWTEAQKAAISARGNILVSAAAGSGKTATLSERIITLLKDGEASLGEMLIVTYTKPAAGEMKTRIGRKLAEAALEDSSMARHIAALPSAEICTIHSYCHRLLRKNFAVLSLTPDFSVADEAEAEVMKERAMEDVIDDFFRGELSFPKGKNCADIIETADVFGKTRDAGGLDAAMRDLYDRLRSLGLGHEWLLSCADELDASSEHDFLDCSFGKIIRGEIHGAASHYLRVISSLREEIASDPVVAEKYLPAAAADAEYLARLERITRSGSYGEIREAIKYVQPGLKPLSASKKTPESVMFQRERGAMKAELAALAARLLSADEGEIVPAMLKTAKALRSAAEICRVFDDRFTSLKRDGNVLDYSDLEMNALKLLENDDGSPSAAALEEGRRLKFVFIDEYQDTNSVQDRIFRAVAANAESFFVGDVKQSIYRFRGAEPEVFSGYRRAWEPLRYNEKTRENDRDTYAVEGSEINAESKLRYPPGRSIFMSENFRCSRPVIDFVNSVSRFMFAGGSVPFSEEDCLVFGGGEDDETPVEVCLIDKPGRGKKKAEGQAEPTIEEPEAEYVAGRIADMVSEGVRPGNIAVLLRGISARGAVYADAVARRGIPVKSAGKRQFMEESEVLLVFDLLRTVDNPFRDVELAGSLRSSVFGFSLEDLVRVKLSDSDATDGAPLWLSLKKYAENNEEDFGKDPSVHEKEESLRTKCQTAVNRVTALREAERGMSADRFIEYMYSELELFSAPEVTEKPCGETNLNVIRDTASSYESGVFGGLYGFLRFAAEKLGNSGVVSESAENDAVTVMSIHKSKGLEFEVCFLCDAGKKRNSRDETADLLLHRSVGAAMRLPDPGGLVRCGTPMRTAVASLMSKEGTEEEMRVLYVAMTRARRRLVVTGTLEKAEEKLEAARMAAPYCDRYTKDRAVSFLDHILGAITTDGGGDCALSVIPAAEISEGKTYSSQFDEEREEYELHEEKLTNNLDFEYPYGYLANIPSKLSVSRLYPAILDSSDEGRDIFSVDEYAVDADNKGKETPGAESETPRPRYMTGSSGFTPAERGTSTHVVLQFADFEALRRDGARAEIDRLVSLGFITEKMASLVNARQVERFAESALMDRMLSAARLIREYRFNVRLPASDFTEDDDLRKKLSESGEKITVQGVFDCVMEERDGRLALIDYKTDALTAYELAHPEAASDKLISRHKLQLSYYAEACRLLFGRFPDETYIYSLPLGDAALVPLADKNNSLTAI